MLRTSEGFPLTGGIICHSLSPPVGGFPVFHHASAGINPADSWTPFLVEICSRLLLYKYFLFLGQLANDRLWREWICFITLRSAWIWSSTWPHLLLIFRFNSPNSIYKTIFVFVYIFRVCIRMHALSCLDILFCPNRQVEYSVMKKSLTMAISYDF